MGGSESYVRALLDQFARGNCPERVTVLANREVLSAYTELAGQRRTLADHTYARESPALRSYWKPA
jgi:hypothetical protein